MKLLSAIFALMTLAFGVFFLWCLCRESVSGGQIFDAIFAGICFFGCGLNTSNALASV